MVDCTERETARASVWEWTRGAKAEMSSHETGEAEEVLHMSSHETGEEEEVLHMSSHETGEEEEVLFVSIDSFQQCHTHTHTHTPAATHSLHSPVSE
jgi:hypothetical protein